MNAFVLGFDLMCVVAGVVEFVSSASGIVRSPLFRAALSRKTAASIALSSVPAPDEIWAAAAEPFRLAA